MTHFDIPIESYFPWYTYSKDMDLPILDQDMYRLFYGALPFNCESYLWYGDPPEIQNTYIKMGHDNLYLTFDIRKRMGSVGSGSFSHVFTVDSWLEMEKHRLFYLMGTKDKALNYIKTISILMNLYEIIDYSITEMKDSLIYDDDIHISSFKNIKISEVDLRLTDVELINIIKNYDGVNNFYNSLKMYYNKYLMLTTKQMESSKKTIQYDDCMKKFNDEICIVIKEKKKSEKHIGSLIYRLEKIGYRSSDYEKNQKIIFKL